MTNFRPYILVFSGLNCLIPLSTCMCDVDVTINIKDMANIEEASRVLKLDKLGSTILIKNLNIIIAKVPNSKLSEINQSPRVKSVEYSNHCTMIPQPIADNAEFHAKYGPLWGKKRIFYKEYPFGFDGVMPRGKAPGLDESLALNRGDGVHIFIMDTGIRATHEAFMDKDTNMSRVQTSWSAYGEDDLEDVHGHGTHVAGILAGETVGIAEKSLLHSIKVLDNSGYGSERAIIQGIEAIYAETEKGFFEKPPIVNMSMASHKSESVDKSVEKLIDQRMVVVAAAGNNHEDAEIYSPAHMKAVITVGASIKGPASQTRKNVANLKDLRLPDSNFGPCVDVYAPGCYIFSADCRDDKHRSYKTGTSMAAPYVAGLAACVSSQYPSALPWQIKSFITKYASTPNQIQVRAPKSYFGSMLYACVQAFPQLPTDLVDPAFSAQSSQNFYEECFKSFSSSSFNSMQRVTLSINRENSLDQELSDSVATLSLSNEDISLRILSKNGVVESGEERVILKYTPQQDQLLKLDLTRSLEAYSPESISPFYVSYLEYQDPSIPNEWIRKNTILMSQNDIQTYIEVRRGVSYRFVLKVYQGPFAYDLEVEATGIPPADEFLEEEEGNDDE